MKRFVFIFVFITFLLSACYKDINIYDQDNYEPKLGISSVFTKDSTFLVWVYKSAIPGRFTKDNFLDNAIVKLYEDGNFVEQLSYVLLGSYGYYQSTSIAREGHVYRIEVEALNKNAWAQDSVPSKPDFVIKDILIKDTVVYSGYFKDTNQLWLDAEVVLRLINTSDYYYAFAGYGYSDGQKLWFDFPEQNFSRGPGGIKEFTSIIMPLGNGASGLLYTPSIYTQGDLEVDFEINATTDIANNSITLYFVVARLSKDLYDFYKSLDLYYRTTNNPFVEPVNIKVNVENGLGLFAGYSFEVDSIKINF